MSWFRWHLGAALLAIVTLAGCSAKSPYMFNAKGSEAQHVAGVWWLLFAMAAAVYVVVAGLIGWGVLRGRRTESGKPSSVRDSAFIWIGGVIVPVIILGVVAAATVTTTARLRNASASELRVEVRAKLWWWAVQYPDLGITTANEIHLPAGQPVAIGLDSDNVIHSFWVPQLAGKLDTIPGQHNVLRFTAKVPGTYRGQCAQFCGIEHARMAFMVVVQTPADFARWVSREQRPASPPDAETAAEGAVVFSRLTCGGCHTLRGTDASGTVGPDLSDVGSRKWLASVTIPNTPGNLAAWITDPDKIKPGVLMPPTALSPSDLHALVAFLESQN